MARRPILKLEFLRSRVAGNEAHSSELEPRKYLIAPELIA